MFQPQLRSKALREQRAAAVAAMSTIIERATSESRAINAEESAEFDRREAEVNGIDAQLRPIEAIERAAAGARPIDSGLPGLRTARTLREALMHSGLFDSARANNFCARAELALRLRTLTEGGVDGVAVAPTTLAPVGSFSGTYNRLLQVVPVIPVGGGTVQYSRIKRSDDSPNPGAAEQAAQGDLKSRLLLDADPDSAAIKTWSVHEKLSVQLLSDEPRAAAVVESILRNDLLDVVDAHVYSVMITDAQTFTPSGSNLWENAARAAAELLQAGATSVAVAVNAGDALAASFVKASTSGNYLGRPDALEKSGIRVVETGTVASGKVLAFDTTGRGPQYAEREGVTAILGLSDDDLLRNLRSLLLETRGLCITRDGGMLRYGNASA